MSDPAIAESVDDLVRMLPDLAGAARLLVGFVQRSSQIAENVNGIVDTARQAAAGSDGRAGAGLGDLAALKDRFTRALALVDALAPLLEKPETVASLLRVVESLPKLTAMMTLLEMFLARSSDIAENLNGVVDTFRTAINARWTNDAERARIAALPGRLMDTIESEALHRLLDSFVLSTEGLDVLDRLLRSGAFTPQALDLVGRLANVTVEAERGVRSRDARVGPWGMLKAMSNPDVQRGMAQAIEVARLFGQHSREKARGG